MQDTETALLEMLERSGADWLVADCETADAIRLRQLDHHVVTVGDRPSVLLAYHLWADPLPQPARVYVLFQYADRHPPAPREIQALVDGLAFRRP